MKPNLQDMVTKYTTNKTNRVGQTCICPSCGQRFIKKTYQQAFCNNKGKVNKRGQRTLCKDNYHNTINENRRPYHRDNFRDYYYGKITMSKLIEKEQAYEDRSEDDEGCHPFSEDAFYGGF